MKNEVINVTVIPYIGGESEKYQITLERVSGWLKVYDNEKHCYINRNGRRWSFNNTEKVTDYQGFTYEGGKMSGYIWQRSPYDSYMYEWNEAGDKVRLYKELKK